MREHRLLTTPMLIQRVGAAAIGGRGAVLLAAAGVAGTLACGCAIGDSLELAAAAGPAPPGADTDLTRVWVVGHSGTGKTTTAGRMAERLGALHVDLDELHWLPGWRERPGAQMRAMLAALLAAAPGGRWVVSGNYTRFVGVMLRESMTALVWMRPPFFANQWQLWQRTAARWLCGDTVCNGNVETLRNILQLNSGSILYWGWSGHARCTAKLQTLVDEVLAVGRLRPADVGTLRSMGDVDALVARCTEAVAAQSCRNTGGRRMSHG
jgi:adenylate kinase family enzyme